MVSNEHAQLLKQEEYRKRTHIITTVLHTNITDRLVVMITASDLITHTIAKTTRTKTPTMIAADYTHEIAPTPRRAARAALAITTETDHRSMMARRNTRNKKTRQKHRNRHQVAPQKITKE
jgi:hypothetical protein